MTNADAAADRTAAVNVSANPDHPTGESEQFWRGARFSVLLIFMLVDLMVVPLVGAQSVGLAIGQLVGATILLTALWVLRLRRTTAVLFAVVLVAGMLAHGRALSPPVAIALLVRLLFVVWVTSVILWRVLRDRLISIDALAGAACVYMLLGFAWAHIFVLLEYARPGSFTIPETFLVGSDPRPALTYFSFVTLTTVGYGVIHPTSLAAGGACVAEAIVGQLYLAIMIARLVGLRVARHGA